MFHDSASIYIKGMLYIVRFQCSWQVPQILEVSQQRPFSRYSSLPWIPQVSQDAQCRYSKSWKVLKIIGLLKMLEITPKSWKDLKMGLFQDTQGTSNHGMEWRQALLKILEVPQILESSPDRLSSRYTKVPPNPRRFSRYALIKVPQILEGSQARPFSWYLKTWKAPKIGPSPTVLNFFELVVFGDAQ